MNRFRIPGCSLFLTLVWILFGCGGATPDAKSGASDTGDGETEVTMSEPTQLRPLGGSSEAGQIEACKLEGPLPGEIPADADTETLHGLGQERILGRDGPAAVLILGKAAKMAPKNAKILGDYATALLQCRFFDEAILNAREANALEPDNIDIAANLAQTYQIAGRIDEAVASYREAIRVDPKDAAAHNNLAVLLVLSDLEEAEREARAAVNMDPENATYLVNLGYVLFRLKRFVDAEMILNRAKDVDPTSANVFNQLGLVFAAQKKNAEATEAFRKALELQPDHMAAKENLDAMDQGFDFKGPWDKQD